jgi:hypothetical protein
MAARTLGLTVVTVDQAREDRADMFRPIHS